MARFSFVSLVVALMGLSAEAFVSPRLMTTRASPLNALKMPAYDLTKDKNLDIVFANNKKYVADTVAADPGYFKNFGNGQAPQILWIGCADSRVPETSLLGLDVGDVFVTRNVANVISHMDNSMMSVLQYAVEALKVKHIIVCGHYKCGGVVASTQNVDHTPPLSQWVRNIRETQRLHADELRSIADEETRVERLIELNVIEQCLNLFKTGIVQRRKIATYDGKESSFTLPRIHPMVYDPTTGVLKPLNVDFNAQLRELGDIYSMYFPE